MNNIYKIINRERKLLLRTKIFKLSIPGKLKYFSTHLVDLLSLLFTSSFKSEKKKAHVVLDCFLSHFILHSRILKTMFIISTFDSIKENCRNPFVFVNI